MIADSLASVEANYYVLQISLDEFSRFARRDLEVSAKVNEVASEMTKFDFLLVPCLRRTLQKSKLSAAGQVGADAINKAISLLWIDEKFFEFWQNVKEESETVDVINHWESHKRKAPKRYEVGSCEGSHSSTPEDLYRVIYFAAIDRVVSSIKDRFAQRGDKVYVQLQNLLTRASSGEDYSDDINQVVRLYEGDIELRDLKANWKF